MRSVLVGVVGFALVAGGCTSGVSPQTTFDRQGMLRDWVDVVIIPSFEASVASASALHTAAATLCQGPDQTTLDAAQQAWKDAKRDWKRTDAMQFGPVEELQAKSAVDTWPAANVFLESAISQATTIDEAYVASRGGSQRGLAALEYLLFGRDRDDALVLNALTDATSGAARCQYVVAAAADLRTTLQAVVDAWRGNFRQEFTSAGGDSATYPTVKSAVDQVVNQLVVAAESIAGRRLAVPLGLRGSGTPEPNLVESPYADRSIDDMLDILQGIENLHRGRFGDQDALGLDDYLLSTNAEVNTKVLQDIQTLRSGLEGLPPPLRTALTTSTTQVQGVYQHSRDVKRVFGTDVVAALGVTLVFSDNDGD